MCGCMWEPKGLWEDVMGGIFCLHPLHTAWHERAGDPLACSSMETDIAEGNNVLGLVLDATRNVRCLQLAASCSDLSRHTARRCRPLLGPTFRGNISGGLQLAWRWGPCACSNSLQL